MVAVLIVADPIDSFIVTTPKASVIFEYQCLRDSTSSSKCVERQVDLEIPEYVIDLPNGHGKVPVSEGRKIQDDQWEFTNWDGEKF